MKILAVADVHYPRFQEKFRKAIQNHDSPDLFLMAGDMVNRGEAEAYPELVDVIQDQFGTNFPIVACFGNEEYAEVRPKILALVKNRITILDEKFIVLEIDGIKIGIVGTQGSLDKPTSWQRSNLPGIKEEFARRAVRANSLLQKLSDISDRRILLMHHAPCTETCEGEDIRSFGWLGSRKFYAVLTSEQPDLVIHGHVHNSITHEAKVGATLVRNVALPAVGDLTSLVLWDKPSRDP
ncbi:MAG: metallophosphoesterase family protein [Candidatus Thorarchaeota archaeon]